MPYAVTHFLVAVILLGLYRDYFIKNKKKFPLSYVLLGGVAGVLPDLDYAVFYILSFWGGIYEIIHRTVTHTVFWPVLFFFLGWLIYAFEGKKGVRVRNIFFVIAFGIMVHIILDTLIIGRMMLFYPLSIRDFGLNLYSLLPLAWQDSFLQSLDAALLVLWVRHLEMKHRISDFI